MISARTGNREHREDDRRSTSGLFLGPKGRVWPFVATILGLVAPTALAQPASDFMNAKVAALETAVKSAQSAGDNAWMLVGSALVLMMTGPGLALFYGGLVRRKNVLGTMMQSFILMAVVTVIWAVVGYSLAFGEGNAFIGDLRYLFLNGVGSAPNAGLRRHHPAADVHGLPVDVRHHHPGADLRRLRGADEIQRACCCSWCCGRLIVYFPMAHMVWGKGGLLNAFLGGEVPMLRFRGRHGGAHHLRAFRRWSVRCTWASASAIPNESMKPHSLVLSFIGACLLWVGWFGFNAGSALGASGLATSAFVATHFGAAAAALGWMVAEWMQDRQAERAGRHLRARGRTGGDHARLGIREAHVRRCSSDLLPAWSATSWWRR